MNKHEWLKKPGRLSTVEYKKAHKLLNDWKSQNGITERCVVHHRDDTEETQKYNEEHYELWGCNEDGTFEYGKYIVFMTNAEHVHYHRMGKKLSEETRAKLSAAQKDKLFSEETRAKLSATQKGERNSMYGKHHSEETRARMSAAHKGKLFSEETRAKLSAAQKGKIFSEEHRAKISAAMSAAHKGMSTLYATYKNNGGILKWNDFQKALKNGEITFEMQPITVYTK